MAARNDWSTVGAGSAQDVIDENFDSHLLPFGPESALAIRSLEESRDRELVRRLGGGDEDAFRNLFRRYGPSGNALALRIVRQPFLAEEILQEAFLALWRNPGAYREELGSVRGWLMAAVHHRAVDYVRREEAARRRARESEPAMAADDVADEVAEIADETTRRAGVRAALKELPAEQRQVLELMYYEGKTPRRRSHRSLPCRSARSRVERFLACGAFGRASRGKRRDDARAVTRANRGTRLRRCDRRAGGAGARRAPSTAR